MLNRSRHRATKWSFIYEDNGNCRVYYSGPGGGVYCYQQDRPDYFEFYSCSRDGEPSYPTPPPLDLPTFDPQERIGHELVRFLAQKGAQHP